MCMHMIWWLSVLARLLANSTEGSRWEGCPAGSLAADFALRRMMRRESTGKGKRRTSETRAVVAEVGG